MNGGRGCFLAGDSRTNEQLVLTSMHTLFVREHNRIARALGRLNPGWDGEKIYQETRKIVGAVLQKITYQDFLPIIIGNTLPRYRGYNPNVNPDLLNAFSTAAFRFGHTLIRPTFDVLDKNFNPKQGVSPLPLAHLFFNTSFLRDNGIDGLLLGLLANSSENFDQKLATPLLKQLFERPDSPGLNLAALNIQRSRDHGLPGYNAYRHVCGLKSATSFWSTRREIQSRLNRICLRRLYGSPKNADLFVAGLGEAPANGGIVGATFGCIIREQFRRLRDGDRFFYKKSGVFTPWQLREINKATMSRIMCDNLKNIVSVQRNAFFAGNRNVRRVECAGIPRMNLRAWRSGGTSRRIRIYIRSEGCRDRRRTGSGRAFIRINGIDYSRHSNGYNIVVINGRTGRVEQRRSFFTRSNFAANRMVDFLKSLRFHRGKFVLVAIQRDGSQGLNFRVRRALRGIGAGAIFRSQCSSFALIERSGGRGLVAQVQRGRWRGPSVISRYIYLQR
ncbi:eosinophil peroxidase-like [Dendronephthya gigantea]|uniref:eosinophil peroxidase-like n=1 Tax=Dendronephthya gigantea TaxID=151771 RepID=UPI00106CA2D3|nr:eosinophil peroxidase-like [Dendronephthya gigantea]XP_028417595.1 eosinophil peroxidase-like [Dendronephthya gigantea]